MNRTGQGGGTAQVTFASYQLTCCYSKGISTVPGASPNPGAPQRDVLMLRTQETKGQEGGLLLEGTGREGGQPRGE